MKRLAFVMFAALAVSSSLAAQQFQPVSLLDSNNDAWATPAVSTAFSAGAPTLSSGGSFLAKSYAALPDAPAPAPPRSSYDGPRFTLASGYEYVHFKSAPFSANMSGIHTSLAYALNDTFAVEGNVVAAFGGDVFQSGEMSKYVLLTGGGRIFWDRNPRRFSPWLHAAVGVAHVNPQIARSSKNGFALQAGGGVDYFLNPQFSLRGEADYVRTQLYSSSQNNFQIGIGFAIHF